MPRAKTFTITPTSDADGISTSQTPGAAGNLTITGALAANDAAIFSVAHKILITTASNETAKTLTITGLDQNGQPVSEVVTGPNATTAETTGYFLRVDSIAVSAAFAGAVTVGTNAKTSTPWIVHSRPTNSDFNVGIGCTVASGSITYTVQKTFDDVQQIGGTVTFSDHDSASLVGATTSATGNYGFPCIASRIITTSGTGTLRATFVQTGM